MSLHDDLLEQAKHLAARDRGRPRPKQANLRRSVSAAYHALFHLLVDEATRLLVSDRKLGPFVARTFDHGEMKQASQAFASGGLPRGLAAIAGGIVPQDLKDVAQAFIDLQLARHDADYNVERSFSRGDVKKLLEQADDAFEAWVRIQDQPIAGVYLTCLLLWKKRR